METAILVGLITARQKVEQVNEYLDELAFLAFTAGARIIKKYTQKLEKPDHRTFVGKGKLQEIKNFITDQPVDMVIFDDDLSPSQVKNIENELQCKILDRSLLILDIFAMRAKTAQAKIQVELAQHQYLLPRLTGLWTHLSKQKGGIGLKGPGETEIETDRRVIKYKISLLKKKLENISVQDSIRRKNRTGLLKVSLVGYTNTGKSTLMNKISKSDVLAENKLFATLDSTIRRVDWENTSFLLTDTVGFIRKLPHHLIESFKSTLEEIREADLLLEVIDISHPVFLDQMKTVSETLNSLGCSDKPIIKVFNKIDLLPSTEIETDNLITDESKPLLCQNQLENSWLKREYPASIFISAFKKINIVELKSMIVKTLGFGKK